EPPPTVGGPRRGQDSEESDVTRPRRMSGPTMPPGPERGTTALWDERPADRPPSAWIARNSAGLGRGVGVVVLVAVGGAAGLLALAVWAGDPKPGGTPTN